MLEPSPLEQGAWHDQGDVLGNVAPNLCSVCLVVDHTINDLSPMSLGLETYATWRQVL